MRRWSRVVGLAIGLAAPLALCLLWIPIRSHLPNTDLALLLVLVTVAAGTLGRRPVVFLSACAAALAFEFFDTRPFEHVAIASSADLETTLVLVVVGAVGGELAVRVSTNRARARSQSARVESIGATAALLASGEELVLVIEAVARRLTSLLGLSDCTFLAGPGEDGVPVLNRTGDLEPASASGPGDAPAPWRAVLQVWGDGQVLGHFLLELPPGRPLPPGEDLIAAITLSDQVGAAFMAQAPPPPDPARQPAANLHVVR